VSVGDLTLTCCPWVAQHSHNTEHNVTHAALYLESSVTQHSHMNAEHYQQMLIPLAGRKTGCHHTNTSPANCLRGKWD
jgi:hypothetical protein